MFCCAHAFFFLDLFCFFYFVSRFLFGQVTINAVENSASVASLVLTTECLIAEIPVVVSEAQQQANYDAMGGGDYM